MTNGKRALGTGSSRGIGRAIAVGLAQDGYEILVHCAGNRAKAEETQAIIEHAGGAAAVLQADLCNTAETAALADPVYARQVIDSIPVGYYGMPEDCVGVVRLLCAQAGRYITGQSLYVDGGKSIQ